MILLSKEAKLKINEFLKGEKKIPIKTKYIPSYSMNNIDEQKQEQEVIGDELNDNAIAEKDSIYYIIVYATFELEIFSYSLFLFYYDENAIEFTLPYVNVKKGENISIMSNRYTKDFIPHINGSVKIRKIENYILYDISDILNSIYMKEKTENWKWLSPFEIINYNRYKTISISKTNIDFFMNNDIFWKKDQFPILLFKDNENNIYYNNSKIDIENLDRCLYFYKDIIFNDEDVEDIGDETLVIDNEKVKILNDTYLLCLEYI